MTLDIHEPWDLRLTDKKTSPTTTLEFVLDEDGQGRKRWREFRAPPLPPRISQGALQWTHQDPRVDLVWYQDDWSGGGFEPYYREDAPNKYASNDGTDTRWKGVIAHGMERKTKLDFLIRNGDAEKNDVTIWTDGTGVTYTTPTGDAKEGTYAHKIVTDGGRANTNSLLKQSLSNPYMYRGLSVTVLAYIKKTAGSDQLRMKVKDGVGTSTTGPVSDASYTYYAVTRIIDASATKVEIDFEASGAESTANTYFIDGIDIFLDAGVETVGLAELGDRQFAAIGRSIVRWDETNKVWDLVGAHTSAVFTDIIEHNSRLIASLGNADEYQHVTTFSTPVVPGDWTTVSGFSDPNDEHAFQFIVSRNVLWRVDYDQKNVSSTSNPAADVWSAAYSVGSTGRIINNLFSFQDTLLVGKEDGLHRYLRVYNDGAAADLFQNITQTYSKFVHPDNFALGEDYKGWHYFTEAQQGFSRFNGYTYEDLSWLFLAPRLTDFGGKVRALAVTPAELWLLVDTPTADTSTAKITWLVSLRNVDGKPIVHPLFKVSVGLIDRLVAHRDRQSAAASQLSYLYAFGRIKHAALDKDITALYRWQLPEKTVAPYADATSSIIGDAAFDSSIHHMGMPDTPKAFTHMTIWTKNNLDADHTIQLKFGLDGAAPSTTVLKTFNSEGTIHTAYFHERLATPEIHAVGRFFQYQIIGATDDTVSPEVYAVAVHASLNPDRFRVFEMFVVVEQGGMLPTGYDDPRSKTDILADLNTLELQNYPLQFEQDFDGDNTSTTITARIIDFEEVPQGDNPTGRAVIRLLVQEVKTS